jgi:TonB family protein
MAGQNCENLAGHDTYNRTPVTQVFEVTMTLRTVLLVGAIFSATSLLAVGCQRQRVVYVKHVEPPSYPPLARMARIRGTVEMLVTIGPDGKVLSVQSETSNVSPVLRDYSEKVINDWTFGCSGCPAGSPFTHTIKFVYALDASLPGNTAKMNMDLPGLVTMSAGPMFVEPSTSTSKKEGD